MGSLMAGWASHIPDPETALLERNKSLTKEEVEAFWKSQQQKQHDHHVEAVVTHNNILQQVNRQQHHQHKLDDKANSTGDWWTRSNWAFLNEPPRDDQELSTTKYTPQFHVAKLATQGA